MAHLNFENVIQDATRLDAPIQRGPMMRWQRKAMENGVRSISISDPHLNTSGLTVPKSAREPRSASGARTPGRSPMTPLSGQSFTPKSGGKSATPGRENQTPGRNNYGLDKNDGKAKKSTGKTPKKMMGDIYSKQDRFIPNRSSMDMEASHHALMNPEPNLPGDEGFDVGSLEYQRKMGAALNDVPQDSKILSFKAKAPQAKEGHINNLKVLYSATPSTAPKGANTRQIPQIPERIMDAPEMIDDYYLNLLDWAPSNLLAVGLGPGVYIWDASTGNIRELMELENQDEYVSSVAWIQDPVGSIVAVGNSLGVVQLWDVSVNKCIRTMGGHSARVGCLSWNSYIVSSGSRSGAIHHHDVRVAEHQVAALTHHTQEVCGLAWSANGTHLASGANDNMLNVWDASIGNDVQPLHTFTQHQSAVKALAWCPWQTSLLASGGGTADRCIRLWNVSTGACLKTVDTNSQVSSICWSKEHKELISGHGFSQNQLTIWKYPAMTRVAELTGHTARVLCLTMSPDGSTVASAGGDETIRLWKCFAVDAKETKSAKPSKSSAKLSMLTRGIR